MIHNFNISNLLSILRLFSGIPLVICLHKMEILNIYWWYSIYIIVFIVLSDILDGFLARKFNSVTSFGTGYEAGDLLTIPGIPYNPAPIKLFSATETIDNSAGEIFNTRQGVGTYLYKEGSQHKDEC